MNDTLEDLLAEGNALWRSGASEMATDVFRRAVDLAEHSYGSESVELISPLRGLAASIAPPIDGTLEQYQQALALQSRALGISEAHLGQDQPAQISLLRGIGTTLHLLRRYEEAREYTERALAIGERAYGEGVGISYSLICLVLLLIDMNLHAEAIPFAERRLRIEEKDALSRGSDSFEREYLILGRCLMGAGRKEEALSYLERYLARVLEKKPNAQGSGLDELRGWIETLRNSA